MTRAFRNNTRRGERGAALVVAILVLAILTVIGIALMLITSTESKIAANEWSANRAFYASDAGIRWSTAVMASDVINFMQRTEFTTATAPYTNSPFGTVLFPLPSHRHGAGTFFTGDTGVGTDIYVTVQTPSLLGRRFAPGYVMNVAPQGRAQYNYAFEVRSTGGQNDALLQYSKALLADVEVGPLPDQLPWIR